MDANACSAKSQVDVLMVDDDLVELALFGTAIDKSNFDIWLRTATRAEEAINYLQGSDVFSDRSMYPLPDLLLLDLQMPGLGGLGFLAWRKDSPIFATLPVIVLLGLQDLQEIQRSRALGATEFLAKPSKFEEWKDIVPTVWAFGLAHRRK